MTGPACCIQLSGTMSPLYVTETYEQVMALIADAREQCGSDFHALMAAPLVAVTGYAPRGTTAPLAFAPHAVLAVCGIATPEPRMPEVPDAPPEWLRDTTRRDEGTE